ncbi:MAG: hypothetical protein NC833_06205, partial [Candidatus Omnitrophica bacterium]|nr:hypothetical protein [Candidatus Omnitrophota bacterium]
IFFNHIKKTPADLIIIAGDLINFDSFSRFLTYQKISTDNEIEKARLFCNKLLKHCKKIIYIKSNHELRLEKFLIRELGTDKANELFNLGLSLKNFFSSEKLLVVNNWFIQIGDCVIAHPEIQSIVRARPIDWTIQFFETKIKNFNCVVIAHTHKLNRIFRRNKLGIETGCFAKIQDYILEGNFTAYREEPQYLGFTQLKLKNGKTLVNETLPILIKVEDPIF